jgi:hypothetical protein
VKIARQWHILGGENEVEHHDYEEHKEERTNKKRINTAYYTKSLAGI